jgi:lipoprotein signal peptidase
VNPKALDPTAAIVAATTFALDQAAKTVARLALPLCTTTGCRPAGIANTVGFLRVENAGSAFGFLQGMWWWTLFSILGIAAMPFLARRAADPLLITGTALLVGGGLANLADRLLLGGVVDFIDLGVPLIFNLADVALALGCVLIARGLWRRLDPPPPLVESLPR